MAPMTTAPTLPSSMRASVLTAVETIALQERPVPRPGPDEVLVRVGSVGVCGSDVHYYRHGRIGSFVVDSPLVLGHEVGGTIEAVGDLVDAGRVGERVALEPQLPCRRCRQCKTGHLNLCPHMEFFATPPVDGAFCDYVVLPADFAHPVPDSLSDAAVALCEPLSVGLWANQKGGTRAGSTVFITGAGPIGVVSAMAARAMGATEIVVSDLVESRRGRVADLVGATAVDPREGFDAADVGADVFLECSGAVPALRDGLRAVRPGGTAVLVGHGDDEVMLPVTDLQVREVTLTGIFRYVDTWPVAISLAATGRVDLDALVTATFGLDDVEAALTSDDDPTSMKSVVVVGS
jgi:L-iditol 2-dehydrogenase